MIKSIAIWIALLVCSSYPFCLVTAQNGAEPRLSEIAPGIFIRVGHHGTIFEDQEIANIGFIIGTRCVAVIDTGGSIEEGKALQKAIREKTSLPVCYVINTHVHPDHILGNFAFKKAKTQFVGHANLPRAIQLLGPTYLQRASAKRPEPLPAEHLVIPDKLVKQELRLDLGGRHLLVMAQPQAHTDNDLTIFDEKTQTLWLSDLLFAEHIPVIGGSGSLKGWLKLLEDLQNQTAARVVPGHGPVKMKWPEAASAEVQYLENLYEETRDWLARDGELPEALNTVGYSQKEQWQQFDQFHKRNISTAYTELEWE